ncbi:hypothetical protein [Kamptonema formosum]|uniref:hypothetical protein n=1 Tax=Kamptonema formosum TaxID=331992 RepID=UPI00037C8D30|nr:hypothetical protein [Oscillatoria sp. PCC 10802]
MCVNRSAHGEGKQEGIFAGVEILPVPIAGSGECRHRLCKPSVLVLNWTVHCYNDTQPVGARFRASAGFGLFGVFFANTLRDKRLPRSDLWRAGGAQHRAGWRNATQEESLNWGTALSLATVYDPPAQRPEKVPLKSCL